MRGLDALAERVAGGHPAGDALRLVFDSPDLVSISMLADEVRRRTRGAETTFVRVFEVGLDRLPASSPGGLAAGEFRLTGSAPSLEAAADAVAALRPLAGQVPLFGFALHEVAAWGDVRNVCRMLREAGLDGISEVVLDRQPSAAAVHAARDAGLLVLRATVHDAPADPLRLLEEGAQFLAAAGGIRAFAPLPRGVSAVSPTTGYDDVKVLAAARLLLVDGPSIQVDWPLYGPKLAQVGLIAGADDVDGVPAVEGSLGRRRSPLEEIRRNIVAAGQQPVERDGRFERLRGAGDGQPR